MGKKGKTSDQITKKAEQDIDKPALNVIIEAMHDRKALEVVDINLSKLDSSICDYFVIASAESSTHVEAIAVNVEKEMFDKLSTKVIRRNGYENAFWIILDYGDIMVHIFQTEYREFYRLEELWGDAIITTHTEE